jgi:DNA polymerase-3 subunit delta'
MTWQTVGHDWAVALLRQSLAANRTSHAYLFAGPPQIGKTRLALSLAKALNCAHSNPPCGQCSSCARIERGVHPDVGLISDEAEGATIKIDQVRALRREAVLAPYEGLHRVSILCGADRATTEAANSLLKLLEEPPSHVVLILTAVHADLLPQTIVSRCQRLDLRPATLDVVEGALRERGVAPEEAHLLARLSGGRIGWALRACNDEAILRQREQSLDQWIQLLSADRVERLDYAWKSSRDPHGLRQQLELWTSWWRDLLLLSCLDETHLTNWDRLAELRSVEAMSDVSLAWATLQALEKTALQLKANVNARLALEGLLLSLPHW